MARAPIKKKKGCGPLSHSSAKTLLGCEQKYVNYKVKAIPHDRDYKKSDALAIGSAFHWILESTRHEKPEKISELLEKCTTDPDIGLSEDHKPLVHAMVVKYLRLHKRMGFKILEIEFDITTEEVIGYVDALMEDTEGKWWIVDLKTAKTLYLPTIPALLADPQLNLYAAHASAIAEKFNLDIEKFGGCRWRVATKPALKRKATESLAEYTMRIVKSVKIHDIAVPIEHMCPEETLERHKILFEISKKLHKPAAKPKKNFGNCMSFFKPCEYWSNCHGGYIYSDTTLEIVTEEG